MSPVRSNVRTQPAESERKRLQARMGRVTRAESFTTGPLLEYTRPSGGHLKWCDLYFGGESRAGV
jgi:hypothetical protein